VERPLVFASAFDNVLADRKSAFKRFIGNSPATSLPTLVNFRPTISEFSLLKRAIFAAIRLQFDDDLHSSRPILIYFTGLVGVLVLMIINDIN